MKSTPRTRFLAVASLAIGTASFAFAADTPPSGDRPSASDTRSTTAGNTTDRQDRSSDLSRNASGNNANAPDSQAMSQLLSKTVDAALQGDMRQISQNFYQADQKRFEQGDKDQAQQQNQQLQQASAELKKSFQEKYHQDLSMADASKVFGSDFLRPGSDIGEGARPAGARIGGSQSDTDSNTRSNTGTSGTTGSRSDTGNTGSQSNTGTSGTSGNSSNTRDQSATGATGNRSGIGSSSSAGSNTGTSSTGSQSNTSGSNTSSSSSTGNSSNNTTSADRASSSDVGASASGLGNSTNASTGLTPQAQTMTIPASHGLPAVTLSVVKEGNDWKLNVPDSLTPQKLQQNLARELSRCNDMKAQWPQEAADAQKALAHHVLLAIMDQDSSRGAGANQGNDINSRPGTDRGTATDRDTGASPDRNRPGSSATPGTGNTGNSSR